MSLSGLAMGSDFVSERKARRKKTEFCTPHFALRISRYAGVGAEVRHDNVLINSNMPQAKEAADIRF